LSYITDDPTNPGGSVSRYLPGGGAYSYSGYNSSNGVFAADPDDGSILVLASQSPVVYRRLKQDGSTEVFSQSNGATTYPRQIFLSQVIDPQGNTLSLSYDSQNRLTALTDAAGRQTTFTYGQTGPGQWLVTQITDPFGRSATLTYDTLGRLSSMTDILGITSSFTYDANSLVNSLTTPYGTSSFAYTAPGTSGPPRFADITDPLGYHQRVEWLEPAPIPASDPTATVPQGMATTNQYLTYRDSFYWDKAAYVTAGCSVSGGCDYTKARDTHFLHVANTTIKSTTPESIKYPLENRVWLNYLGQSSSIYTGTFNRPITVGRVLDTGTTQLRQYAYDTAGYFNRTQAIDAVGRTTSLAYANHVDLSAISQTVAFGIQQTVAQFTYNSRHRPLFFTDAASQTTAYAYNAAGQLTSRTNPLGQTTQYQYDAFSNLTTIINANGLTAASLTYDALDRVATYTDSEGWTVTFSYDNADRITKITYPDGTAEQYTYKNLDLASHQDRQGNFWVYTHDANRRLTAISDPTAHQTLFGYNPSDELTSLTDPNGNATGWTYDVEGRLTQKTYADSSTVTYVYENTTSRLKSVTDALGQTKQYGYTKDNRIAGITYLSPVNPTPNVSFAYDPYFPRRVSMTDGNGLTQYTYTPVGSLGALQLQQEQSPLASSVITYAYDALGRPTSRSVAGAGAETFQYDALGRLATHATDLGSFTLGYLGQTGQIASRQLTSSSLATTWSYLANSGDRRLAGINNVGLAAAQFSTYTYTTTPENFISAISETSDTAIVYPTAGSQTASYNDLNQLTNVSGQSLSFDADGNLLSDGLRTYAWDAENRLLGITYPAQPGKQTTFAYDGISRRTAITSAPAGGGAAVTTAYLWCGSRICQARNASNATTREYQTEGEFVPGSPGQPYYYGPDQIGSVRRVFASTSSAPANSYDPYGVALQTTTPLTDFNYAGMFFNADSGLYLTQFRAYDPSTGRWISRDPSGEGSNAVGNLYTYVLNDPLDLIDPLGLNSQYSIGVGGTLALFLGAGTSGSVGVSVPTNPFSIAEYQVFVSAQVQVLGGSGGFAGVGAQGSYSTSSGSLPVFSASAGSYAEADIGPIGVSVQGSNLGGLPGIGGDNITGGSGGLPFVGGRYSFGGGIFLGAGTQGNVTLATPTFGQIYSGIAGLFGASAASSSQNCH
jgi:RHS repeat-associated protein